MKKNNKGEEREERFVKGKGNNWKMRRITNQFCACLKK